MILNKTILRSYLFERNLLKGSASVSFKEIGRGAFNITYLVKISDGRRLLFRFIIWSMRDHITNMARYESLVLENLRGLDISPKLLFVDETRRMFPYSLIVEDYIIGKTIKQSKNKFVEQVLDALPVIVKLHRNGKIDGLTIQSEILSNALLKEGSNILKNIILP